MFDRWTSIVLGGVAAACGIYVRVSLWNDMPEELGFTIYSMIFLGLIIMLMNIRWLIQERERKDAMGEKRVYKLKMPCPNCEKDSGMRLVDDGNETRVVCVLCEEIDQTITEYDMAEALSAITQLCHDSDGLTKDQVSKLLEEKFELPEFEDEEEEGDAS